MSYAKKIMVSILSLILLLGISLSTSFQVSATENDLITTDGDTIVEEQTNSLEPIKLDEIKYNINKNLSEEKISDRFNEINSSYKVFSRGCRVHKSICYTV